MGRTIAIANQKGGVGKTTTAINLSACLAISGEKVLLIDIDPQANTTSGLGIRKEEVNPSIYEVLIGGIPVKEAILSVPDMESLHLLPSSPNLAGAEIELVNLPERERRLEHALSEIKDAYRYIFVDCPPSLSLLTLNALTAADSILIPLQCEYYALEGLSLLLSTVSLVQHRLNPHLRIEGILLTMYDGRTNLSQQVAKEVRSHFREKVYQTIIPCNVRLAEAPSFGRPAILYDFNSNGSQAYIRLAQEVVATDK